MMRSGVNTLFPIRALRNGLAYKFAYPLPMNFTATGVKQETGKYLDLWGFYGRGFKPWNHCFACFYGTQEKLIHKEMHDDSFELPEPTSYFYLCGVASGPRSQRGKNNL